MNIVSNFEDIITEDLFGDANSPKRLCGNCDKEPIPYNHQYNIIFCGGNEAFKKTLNHIKSTAKNLMIFDFNFLKRCKLCYQPLTKTPTFEEKLQQDQEQQVTGSGTNDIEHQIANQKYNRGISTYYKSEWNTRFCGKCVGDSEYLLKDILFENKIYFMESSIGLLYINITCNNCKNSLYHFQFE